MIIRDIAYAGSVLRRSPLFTLTAALTIALGIGATTAVFSVTDAVLLRPLPYRDPGRLVLACADMRKRDVKDFPFSNASFFDLRSAATGTFEEFAAVRTGRSILPRPDGTLEQVRFANVTTNFFRLMGARIRFGRDFEEADGQPQPQPDPASAVGAPAPPPLPAIAILSYDFFVRRYGGDSSILGRGMLNGGAAGPQVVGVLAPEFQLLFPPEANIERTPDVWIAARLAYDAANRNNVSLRVIGRLKRKASLQQAQAEADAFSAFEQQRDGIMATSDWHVRLVPMQQHLVAAVRPAILALMGAGIFLLLIACSNVANLMLVRVSLRERELAVRTALGGSWWALVRQQLAEALLLAGGGAVLGFGLAWVGIRELRAAVPPDLPRFDAIAIDPRVLAFTAAAALVSAVAFGLVPALRAARPDVIHILRASGRTSGPAGGRLLRHGVVVAEVALAFVLLIGSGLMLRSFMALQRIDPGFNPHNLLTFQLLGGGADSPQQREEFMKQVRDRLGALPGVERVTAASPLPLAGGFSPIRWGLEPALTDPSKYQAADFQIVLPGYFQTMGTRLLAGRAFAAADNTADRNGVIIDDVLAAKAFPDETAVGKRILIRLRSAEPEWAEVIGVAAHQRQTSLADPGREQIYFTDGFLGHGVARRWAIRTRADPGQLTEPVRQAIAAINPGLLITEMRTMEAYVDQAQAGARFSLLLISVFATVAVLLAGVGLYGVLSTVVRQRTTEIGVRMALGAAPSGIFRLVIGQALRVSAAGIATGLVAALLLTRVMTTMLVGVETTDPLTYGAMVVTFLFLAAMASWLPARRASALDPTRALQER